MTPDERNILADIERNEAWLRRVAPAHPLPAAIEHVRLQVEIAAGEAWLNRFAAPVMDSTCTPRIKEAVRRELAGARATPKDAEGSPRWGSWVTAIVPVAAAAVIVFGTVIGLSPPKDDAVVGGALSDLVAAAEYVADSEADAFESVALVSARLEELETDVASRRWHDAFDTGLEDLEGDVNELMREWESGDDATESPA